MAGAIALEEIFAAMRQACTAEPVPSLAIRRDRLERCIFLLRKAEDDICAALSADYGSRPAIVTQLVEIGGAIAALRHAKAHLRRWARPRRASAGFALWLGGARAQLEPVPKGLVGIVAPWNFPVQLTFSPLAAALAAGNRVMIKLPEATPLTSALIAELIDRHFAPDEVAVINGDSGVGAKFVSLPFDHILFTGGAAVGRKVMAAASANLTPVTLELGGRSPVIILPDADLRHTARSILSGKLLNAGQICLAPDHVFVPEDMVEALVASLFAASREMLGKTGADALNSIISSDNARHLRGLVSDAQSRGARIFELGFAHGENQISPCLVVGARPGMAILQEEIFGPLLPIIAYDDLGAVLSDISCQPHPLALYIFGHDNRTIRHILDNTVSGGVTINDILLHASSEGLPLGGIGESGMGVYRGKWGFDTFSHLRPVFRRGWLDAGKLLRPPYGKLASRAARFLVHGR
ncbi:aldehyde dehydrogenase family protein [Novosphingobium aquae]|uniref:Aldehyde dehydrogenase n=1 Tax=Novosphingobium aquae TaxID=3133435 RepID=A0ABU8SA23_9SPHN